MGPVPSEVNGFKAHALSLLPTRRVETVALRDLLRLGAVQGSLFRASDVKLSRGISAVNLIRTGLCCREGECNRDQPDLITW